MAENRGKQFEQQIRQAFEKEPDVSVVRLIDPQAGYAGVRNICDFIVYKYPTQYFLECKSHHGNTFPFSCVTDNQWHGLLQMSKIKGVKAGIIIWFIDHDITIYVPIETLDTLKQSGAKSIKWSEYVDGGLLIDGIKKRVLFDYDMKTLLDKA